MVIQEDSEVPMEESVMKTLSPPLWDGKKYVLIKNHVRDMAVSTDKSNPHTSTSETSTRNKRPAKKTKKTRFEKSEVIMKKSDQKSSENTSVISKEDLEELRTVYKRCKAVINKIETKYGHLLNLDASTSTAQSFESNTEEECQCKGNKKIIYDDDGQETVTELDLKDHICPKKVKRKHSNQSSNLELGKVDIQFEHQNIPLPDDLKSLTNILQGSDIAVSYRNKVINKVKLLRMELGNEIKFIRPSLIQRLKSEADTSEIFEFNGANLFSLPGYPVWK